MIVRVNKLSAVLFSAIFFILGSVFFQAFGQDNIRVQGKITDVATGEPIAAVNVIDNGYVVAYSDIDGIYSLSLIHI